MRGIADRGLAATHTGRAKARVLFDAGMPEIHFIGTIESVNDVKESPISLTWTIVPGSDHGDTHTCTASDIGFVVLNHPIDMQYNVSSVERWAYISCQAWIKADGTRRFYGQGSAWMPSASGNHLFEVILWQRGGNAGEELIGFQFTSGNPPPITPQNPDIILEDSTVPNNPVGRVEISMNVIVSQNMRMAGLER